MADSRPFRTSRVATGDNAKRFGVWNGSSIGPQYGSIADISDAVSQLVPNGAWEREWIVKVGEGGSYQARYLHPSWGDSHSLAVDSAEKLAAHIRDGLTYGLRVIPYIVVRGRPEWNAAEWKQIADCAAVSERVVLNLEPGAEYWNGPTTPAWLQTNYLDALATFLSTNYRLELACIPRVWVFSTLGGPSAINTWLSFCQSASWECYDATASDLNVAASMARLDSLNVNQSPEYRIPIVQRSRIEAWADSEYCANGMQVWHLDGD